MFHYFVLIVSTKALHVSVTVREGRRCCLTTETSGIFLLHLKYKRPWYVAFNISRRQALVSNKRYIFAVKCWQSNGKVICSDLRIISY